jgi:hypothetical protein
MTPTPSPSIPVPSIPAPSIPVSRGVGGVPTTTPTTGGITGRNFTKIKAIADVIQSTATVTGQIVVEEEAEMISAMKNQMKNIAKNVHIPANYSDTFASTEDGEDYERIPSTDERFKSVELTVTMPLSIDEFDEYARFDYTEAIANTFGIMPSAVTIKSVNRSSLRRLLSQTVDVVTLVTTVTGKADSVFRDASSGSLHIFMNDGFIDAPVSYVSMFPAVYTTMEPDPDDIDDWRE